MLSRANGPGSDTIWLQPTAHGNRCRTYCSMRATTSTTSDCTRAKHARWSRQPLHAICKYDLRACCRAPKVQAATTVADADSHCRHKYSCASTNAVFEPHKVIIQYTSAPCSGLISLSQRPAVPLSTSLVPRAWWTAANTKATAATFCKAWSSPWTMIHMKSQQCRPEDPKVL